MDRDDSFISRLEVNGEPIYVRIIWMTNGNDLFQIQVLDNSSRSWSGNYSLEEARAYASGVEEDETLYKNNVRDCFKNSCNYLFDFICSSQSTYLSWKKKYENSTAVLEHGKVSLIRDESPETKYSLIDFLLKKNKELKQVIDKSRATNEILSMEVEKCKNDLDTFAEMKISLESSLYSKFQQLLNAKKERIQLLEDLLENAEKCG